MTPAQWRLARRVVAALEAEAGMTDAELAGALGVTIADLVPVLRVMYRQRRIDRCWSWTVLAPCGAEGRRAA